MSSCVWFIISKIFIGTVTAYLQDPIISKTDLQYMSDHHSASAMDEQIGAKDNAVNQEWLDNIQQYIDKMKTKTNPQPSRRDFTDGNIRTFTDFIWNMLQILSKFDDPELEYFIDTFNNEIRNYNYDGCKFHELTENQDLIEFIANKLDEFTDTPAAMMRNEILAMSSKIEEDKYNENEKDFIDYINSLYKQDALEKFDNILIVLDDYRLKARKNMNLEKIIRKGVRSIIFDYYTELNSNDKTALKSKINEYWDHIKPIPLRPHLDDYDIQNDIIGNHIDDQLRDESDQLDPHNVKQADLTHDSPQQMRMTTKNTKDLRTRKNMYEEDLVDSKSDSYDQIAETEDATDTATFMTLFPEYITDDSQQHLPTETEYSHTSHKPMIQTIWYERIHSKTDKTHKRGNLRSKPHHSVFIEVATMRPFVPRKKSSKKFKYEIVLKKPKYPLKAHSKNHKSQLRNSKDHVKKPKSILRIQRNHFAAYTSQEQEPINQSKQSKTLASGESSKESFDVMTPKTNNRLTRFSRENEVISDTNFSEDTLRSGFYRRSNNHHMSTESTVIDKNVLIRLRQLENELKVVKTQVKNDTELIRHLKIKVQEKDNRRALYKRTRVNKYVTSKSDLVQRKMKDNKTKLTNNVDFNSHIHFRDGGKQKYSNNEDGRESLKIKSSATKRDLNLKEKQKMRINYFDRSISNKLKEIKSRSSNYLNENDKDQQRKRFDDSNYTNEKDKMIEHTRTNDREAKTHSNNKHDLNSNRFEYNNEHDSKKDKVISSDIQYTEIGNARKSPPKQNVRHDVMDNSREHKMKNDLKNEFSKKIYANGQGKMNKDLGTLFTSAVGNYDTGMIKNKFNISETKITTRSKLDYIKTTIYGTGKLRNQIDRHEYLETEKNMNQNNRARNGFDEIRERSHSDDGPYAINKSTRQSDPIKENESGKYYTDKKYNINGDNVNKTSRWKFDHDRDSPGRVNTPTYDVYRSTPKEEESKRNIARQYLNKQTKNTTNDFNTSKNVNYNRDTGLIRKDTRYYTDRTNDSVQRVIYSGSNTSYNQNEIKFKSKEYKKNNFGDIIESEISMYSGERPKKNENNTYKHDSKAETYNDNLQRNNTSSSSKTKTDSYANESNQHTDMEYKSNFTNVKRYSIVHSNASQGRPAIETKEMKYANQFTRDVEIAPDSESNKRKRTLNEDESEINLQKTDQINNIQEKDKEMLKKAVNENKNSYKDIYDYNEFNDNIRSNDSISKKEVHPDNFNTYQLMGGFNRSQSNKDIKGSTPNYSQAPAKSRVNENRNKYANTESKKAFNIDINDGKSNKDLTNNTMKNVSSLNIRNKSSIDTQIRSALTSENPSMNKVPDHKKENDYYDIGIEDNWNKINPSEMFSELGDPESFKHISTIPFTEEASLTAATEVNPT